MDYTFGIVYLKPLVGKKVQRVFFNEDYLKFVTDQGDFTYSVYGDCCSNSLFYDFVGVKKLLENGPVTAVEEVEMHPNDIEETGESYPSYRDRKAEDEDIKVYGYRLITEHPEFGEQSSVFSFRNYSNGYYGGEIEAAGDQEVQPEIFDDVSESASVRPTS